MAAILQAILSDASPGLLYIIFILISLKFVTRGTFDNKPATVQRMAWRSIGDKPLSKLMMVKPTDAEMRHSALMSWRQMYEENCVLDNN